MSDLKIIKVEILDKRDRPHPMSAFMERLNALTADITRDCCNRNPDLDQRDIMVHHNITPKGDLQITFVFKEKVKAYHDLDTNRVNHVTRRCTYDNGYVDETYVHVEDAAPDKLEYVPYRAIGGRK